MFNTTLKTIVLRRPKYCFHNLVSIVIPCYNAESWVKEALDSCLRQTYDPIEIIVINDGSTDQSLKILQSYKENIKLETGLNFGGNHARNRGFALSRGEYIQFLDADDYLLPEKIEHQVRFLQVTGADVVYGDWRHQFHKPDETSYLDDIQISGHQPDVLESLLAGWWVAPAGLLFRRDTVINSGGWDESLRAGQDRDFLLSVAMTGADIRYQPGCHSIYRRYGNVTVSTSNRRQWLENHQCLLEKAEKKLLRSGRLTENYREALAKSYFLIARNYYNLDLPKHIQLIDKVRFLSPQFKPSQSWLYDSVYTFLGLTKAEQLASYKRKLLSRLDTKK